MRGSLTVIIFLGIGLFVTGCGGSYGCDASVIHAVDVSIYDAETREPAAEGALLTIRDGSFVETAQGEIQTSPDSSGATYKQVMLGGAYERPGTYTVRVEKVGYIPWERTDIRVRDGDCHVDAVRLEAYLERIK